MLALVMSWSLSLALAAGLLLCCACRAQPKGTDEPDWTARRAEMVALLRRHGIRDARVLAAMDTVRRHGFIPEPFRERGTAYGDYPCPIGSGQTISQPYIVAYMTEKLDLKPGAKVLEVGSVVFIPSMRYWLEYIEPP